MAGRGPSPKDPSERRRRNLTPPITMLSAGGKKHGPELPDVFDWPQATVTWWDTWRTSDQAAMFIDTDWSFLLDTAILHGEFWSGNRAVAAELRLRVAKFGATPEDRARLRIAVGDPDSPVTPATRLRPTKTKENREARLLRAIGDGDG